MVRFGNNAQGKCAKEIIEFLFKHHLWQDTYIYVNGKRYGDYDPETKTYHYYIDEDDTKNPWDCVFVEKNMNPKDYLDYAGDFLSMSFEGPFYEIINYCYSIDYCDKIVEEFRELISKYGYYFEQGNAWNLSLYPSKW